MIAKVQQKRRNTTEQRASVTNCPLEPGEYVARVARGRCAAHSPERVA